MNAGDPTIPPGVTAEINRLRAALNASDTARIRAEEALREIAGGDFGYAATPHKAKDAMRRIARAALNNPEVGS